MEFVCDSRYGWAEECDERFGRAPALICHEWNTAAHVSEFEGRPGRRPALRDGFGAELTRLGYGRSTAEAELQSMAH